MHRHVSLIAVCAAFALAASPSFAKNLGGWGGGGVGGGACVQNENAQLTINFNGSDNDVTNVKSKLDDKIQEIKTLADQQHFTKFFIQSSNYNINSNFNNGYGSDGQFTYNGNVNFSIQPADKAVTFMATLSKKGYHANINVNSYNNGNCDQNSSAAPTAAPSAILSQ